MKIVCVGDILLPPEMMEAATPDFPRYDEAKYFFFGPDNRTDMRAYIKKMEAEGSRCVPVPEEIMKEIEDCDVLQVHMMPVPAEVFERAKNLKFVASNRGGVENIDVAAATKAAAGSGSPASYPSFPAQSHAKEQRRPFHF